MSATYSYSSRQENVAVHHFTDAFAITIQIWWNFCFLLIQFLANQSLLNIAYNNYAVCYDTMASDGITTKLNFPPIWICYGKIVSEMGPSMMWELVQELAWSQAGQGWEDGPLIDCFTASLHKPYCWLCKELPTWPQKKVGFFVKKKCIVAYQEALHPQVYIQTSQACTWWPQLISYRRPTVPQSPG